MQEVTVIIPTLALAERSESIFRAIESVIEQDGVIAVPLLAINGSRRDPGLVARLRADNRLRIVEWEGAGIPGALEAGRRAVETPFFSALDDDDFLLPGALAARIHALTEHPEYDAIVTNGYRRNGTSDILHVPDGAAVHQDPLAQLLHANWLLPGSWLCRTSAAGLELFSAMPRYRECTYLAVRFAITGRMMFLDQPTVVWHTGRDGTESSSRYFHLSEADAMLRILELPLPPTFRAGLRRKLSAACHAIADIHRTEGAIGQAWSWHLRSLWYPGGYRYTLYTRRLLAAMAGL